jgi:hypothetical protein
MFEPHPDPSRIVPARPLGPWALRPLRRLLAAVEPGHTVTLDLEHAPVSTPGHVATLLWIDDAARELGVTLEIVTPDMVSAELLDFAGVHAAVFGGEEHHASEPGRRRASA